MTDFETALLRKVAWRLVPFLCIGYVINALDRYNVSIAALTMTASSPCSQPSADCSKGIGNHMSPTIATE